MRILSCFLFLFAWPNAFAAEVVTPSGNNNSFYDNLKALERDTQDSPYRMSAQECGESQQALCTPDRMGGRTMCGLAVGKILQCMGNVLHHTCDGRCGNGKDFVNCSNGALAKCGYAKIDPRSPDCKKPGAVLAYTKSGTPRGNLYGHVEFVCGFGKYCSIYKADHNQPWPRPEADACWYPSIKADKTGHFASL